MSIRIGEVIISANLIFLGVAYIIFARLSFDRLFPGLFVQKSKATICLVGVSLAGVAGAFLYSLPARLIAMTSEGLASTMVLSFGSFGGYWGVILGSLCMSLLLRGSPLRQADAFVPGILIGGTVARFADVFTGANQGISIHVSTLPWFQPFRSWAVFDVAVLLGVLALVQVSRGARRPPGFVLQLFLVGYGCIRFGIEFLRNAPSYLGPFTHGQVMALVQVAAGIVLLVWLRLRRPGQLAASPGRAK
jgi:hypothetical protein